MKQRTLGILGGALLVGGVVLAIGSGIAAGRFADGEGPEAGGAYRSAPGGFPRQAGPGRPGPLQGDPRRRGGFPPPGQRAPITPSPPTTG
jgi:hypothetical protein